MSSTTNTRARVCNDKTCYQSTYVAAKNGHLECLRYAYETGCPWSPCTTYAAAYNGELECLMYAHDSPGASCEWHPRTTYAAAGNGYLECLKYIYENCGDVATWKNARLKNDFYEFSREIQDYINSVRENWKSGLNRPGMRTKTANRN